MVERFDHEGLHQLQNINCICIILMNEAMDDVQSLSLNF